MSENVPPSSVARMREQLLLAQARIAALETALSEASRRLDEERALTAQAQEIADRDLDVARVHALEMEIAELRVQLKPVLARMLELDEERRTMQRSRSWRWTAAIRSIERWCARRR